MYKEEWSRNYKVFGYHFDNPNKLYIDDDDTRIPLPSKLKEFLNKTKSIVSSLYELDNWNLQFYRNNDNFIIYVIIKYDSIEVKNTQNSNISTNIKDLYVIYKFKYFMIDNVIKLFAISGTRGVLSFAELNSKYSHSHLPGRLIGRYNINYDDFCLGNGGLRMIYSILNNKFIDTQFQLLLYQMNEFVKWESEEGGPYKHICNIREGSKVSRNIVILSTIDKEYFNDVIDTKLTEEMIDISVYDSKLNIKVSPSIITKIVNHKYCYYEDNGEHYMVDDNNNTELSIQNNLFWNDKQLVTHIVNSDVDWNNREILLIPIYVKYVKKKLETFILHNYINNNLIIKI